MIDRKKFFDHIRQRPFNGTLTEAEVRGVEAILDAWRADGGNDPRQLAVVLGNVYHETGGYMLPIKETVFASHADKNPSDATVVARLNKAWAEGRLGAVKTPYWRAGWFGRGQIQLTHEENYREASAIVGVDLVKHRDRALELPISAKIAVVGMRRGLFTGKKLDDYFDKIKADWTNSRRIVNGDVATNGAKVAKLSQDFYAGLQAAQEAPIAQTAPPAVAVGVGGGFLAWLGGLDWGTIVFVLICLGVSVGAFLHWWLKRKV